MIKPADLALLALLATLPAAAQYVGKVTKDSKESPELRSVAVLEWTGDEGSPKFSRLVPVAVLDAGELQDGGIYLARPEPLALVPEVEYELEKNGSPIGLFDIKNAGQQDGSWVGFGAWKPMPSAKPGLSAKDLAKTHLDDDDAQSDEPVLHRKHPSGESPSSSGGKGDSKSDPAGDSASQAPSDPDRPVMHRKPSAPASADGASGSTGAAAGDPDRPVLNKAQKGESQKTEAEDSGGSGTDPDRPRLKRGKATGDEIEVAPSLSGFPPDVQQTVAVSDARTRPPHPWKYAWSNPEDEAKMKIALEEIARTALGLSPVPSKPAAKRAATATTRKSARPVPSPPPAPLDGEQFRVFELAYGSGATLVLSAHTDGPAAQQKFVTLVAQPDLYGNILVLLKNVTDGSHLDENPRMRLVDAVDAMADNRGELLFELRGTTQRQFALYRVLRGQAEKLFVTGGG